MESPEELMLGLNFHIGCERMISSIDLACKEPDIKVKRYALQVLLRTNLLSDNLTLQAAFPEDIEFQSSGTENSKDRFSEVLITLDYF